MSQTEPQPSEQHTMQCEFPEGCSCGATERNTLRCELEEAQRSSGHHRKLAEDNFDALNQMTTDRDNALAALERVTKERDELKYVFDRNKEGMELGQGLIDAGRWAGFPVVKRLAVELKECRELAAQLRADLAAAKDEKEQWREGFARMTREKAELGAWAQMQSNEYRATVGELSQQLTAAQARADAGEQFIHAVRESVGKRADFILGTKCATLLAAIDAASEGVGG